MKRLICWFSCGAASAVATKLALKEWDGETVVCYQDTGSEHPDNKRFLSECQEWFGQEIIQMKSTKYNDIWDVFEKTRWLAGIGGARCTAELKRKLAEEFINHGKDREVLGYTLEEKHRVKRFIENNPERDMWPILIEKELTKEDCLGILHEMKIEIPAMYKLGYQNNNCIGCVKGGTGYWNKIRKDFPDVFNRMAKVERELNAAINKRHEGEERIRIFLDELDPEAGNALSEPSIQCGLFCLEQTEELKQLEECEES
jgi:3'-phosphoadenosine 5'-phosphosulfate sulfotransferase (PAPS reductase)/FAD synthetase